jgi:glycosyltransferase involved in cell wall biosynthesis
MTTQIRLHIPAVPFTITRDEYSHCAYTGKVKRFSPMMKSRGFEVYHYGVETSESGADKDIQLMTKDEWEELRIKSYMYVYPDISLEEATEKHRNVNETIGSLWNNSTPLIIEFNRRLKDKLKENYRGPNTDIVCLPLASTHNPALEGLDCVKVESGIGYSNPIQDYKIYESYSWMSHDLGAKNKAPANYSFVIPNYFDTNEFKLSLNPEPLKIGFLGRLGSHKGCNIIVEIAKKFPQVQFVLCGNGDPTPFLQQSNIVYKPQIHGAERSEYLGSCVAVLCLSKYLEPFCGVAVEAQLCGTPVISTDWGGMVETVEQFKTGLRGHTLADYIYGVQMALGGMFDRSYIRERAVKLFDMYKLAYKYEYVFKCVLDIHNGKGGWYSPDNHLSSLKELA